MGNVTMADFDAISRDRYMKMVAEGGGVPREPCGLCFPQPDRRTMLWCNLGGTGQWQYWMHREAPSFFA